MDKAQYSTLMEALKDVPDPRQLRGQRYSWVLLLTLITYHSRNRLTKAEFPGKLREWQLN